MAGNRVISAVLTLKDKDFGSTAKKSASATKDLERKVKSTGNAVSKFGKSASAGFKNVALGAAGALAAFAGFNAIKKIGVSMIEQAANAQAMNAQFEQVFGDMEKNAQSSIDGLAKSFGMVPDRIKPAYTKITSMFKGFGMSTEDSMAAASKAVTLSADAAAFYDVAMSDAEGAITSFLKGNTNAAESIGIFATAAGMADFASKELGQNWKKLDEGGKQLVRLKYVEKMQEAAGATGQAARESDGYENVLGNLRQSWDTLKAKLGQPILEPAVKGMQGLAAWVGNIDTEKITNGFIKVGGVLKGVYTAAQPGLNWLKDTALPAVKDKLLEMYESAQPSLNWLKDVAFPGVVDAVGFVIDKVTALYNFFKDNWSYIGPIVAGVVATIAAFRIGVVAVTTATAVWKGVTTAAQIAMALLNGTLAISPLGWVALAIGLVVTAGILLYKNWDTVKAAAQGLWDKVKLVGKGIKAAFTVAFDAVKTAVGKAINFVIDKINNLIEKINLIPGVNIPIIAKVDWSAVETAAPQGKAAGGSVMASYAVGTNRVKRDMVAQIHKDEMIVPAAQSRNLRQQGVTIDNIDKPTATRISRSGGNNINININGVNKSTNEIINELVPQLKLRLANL